MRASRRSKGRPITVLRRNEGPSVDRVGGHVMNSLWAAPVPGEPAAASKGTALDVRGQAIV